MSYLPGSDIFTPYGEVQRVMPARERTQGMTDNEFFKMGRDKRKMASWVVSHCNTRSVNQTIHYFIFQFCHCLLHMFCLVLFLLNAYDWHLKEVVFISVFFLVYLVMAHPVNRMWKSSRSIWTLMCLASVGCGLKMIRTQDLLIITSFTWHLRTLYVKTTSPRNCT